MPRFIAADDFQQFILDFAPYRSWVGEAIGRCNGALRRGGGVGLYVAQGNPLNIRDLSNRDSYRLGVYGPHLKRLTASLYFDDDRAHKLCTLYDGEPVTFSAAQLAGVRLGASSPLSDFGLTWAERFFGPIPPQRLLDRGVTRPDVALYCDFFHAPGYQVIHETACRHASMLTDTCPECDADREGRTGDWAGIEGAERG